MRAYIVSFLLFLLPLFIFPFGTSYFEIPKVILAEFSIALLLLLYFFKQKTFNFNIKNRKYWPFLLIFILTIIDLIFFRTSSPFLGNSFRLQGIFLLWNLLAFALLSSSIPTTAIPRNMYLISLPLLLISTLFLGGNESGRAVGTLGEPNSLAAVAVFLWPFLFFSNQKFKKIPLHFPALVIAGIIIFLSGSRSGLIALIIQLIFIIFYKYIKLSLVKSAIICLLLILASLVLPFLEKGGIFENRTEVWKTAVITGFNNPILGNGFGNITESLKNTSLRINNNIKYQFVDSSHSFILDWWVQGGIPGALLILFLIAQTLKNFISGSKKLELICFLGVVTSMLFNPVGICVLIAFWWLIGQGLYFKNKL
ncbi:MAG: O-antigen ligase family protein [Candidatus Levybacteria bacterium]|nr:O-antigen ligase family protein [Candidatus Levybacteria bacterium]